MTLTVVQVAAGDLTPLEDRDAVGYELLYGSMPSVAGVESTTSYTGIGFDAFSRTLCLNHAGNACRAAFPALWRPAGTAVPTPLLVEAVKARTVVVQRALVPEASGFTPPDGWERTRVTDHVVVFSRTEAPPWPGSRLAAVSGDVAVDAAAATDVHESVEVRSREGGALQFARLAWPGYEIALDGRPLAVEENAQGLIEVRVPPNTDGTLTIDFRPPGFGVGIPLLAAGAVVVLVAGAAEGRARRRGGRVGARYAPRATLPRRVVDSELMASIGGEH